MAEENEKKEKPKATLIKHRRQEAGGAHAAPMEQVDDKKKKVVVVKKKLIVKKPAAPEAPAAEHPVEPELELPAAEPQPVAVSPEPENTRETVVEPAAKTASVAGVEVAGDVKTPPADVLPEPPKQAPKQTSHMMVREIERTPVERARLARAAERTGQRDRYDRPPAPPGSGPVGRVGGVPAGGRQNPRGPAGPSGPVGERDFRGDGRPNYRSPGPRPPGTHQGSGTRFVRAPGTSGGYRPGGPRGPGGSGGYPPRQGGRPPFGPRPARPGGAPGPAPTGGEASGGKKFFKAKKKENYQKKDRVQEKELQVKKKAISRANPVPKAIDIMEVITVSELARKMNLKASELIARLMAMGMMVTINQQIDADTAAILAQEYDCKVNIVSLYDETIIETVKDRDEDMSSRPPIVTIMGHVDHGKTKLLDAIRLSDVVAGEHGGITQHIGAYMVETSNGRITFLDTPGHEAFTMMRARGAQITDIVVLVVAANDGVMPQTIEAINHAKEAGVPIIVAVNKIDLPEANPERVKQQLSDLDLMPEDWGGKTLFVEISALKKQGIDELLDTILLQAEILDLKANYGCKAEGKIIESKIDHGRGIVASVLIERGTLRVGDTFVAGIYPGKVRALFNDHGGKLEDATPSVPVEILGFTGVPNAGDPFQVTESEKLARQIGDKRQELKKQEEARNLKKITLDNLYDSIQEGTIKELKVVLKGDVHGSVEALKTSLERLSTKEIKLSVIHASAGAINEGDIRLASASNAIIIGFHVRPTPKAQQLADIEKVEIRKYNIIYDAVDEIKTAMEGLLAPELKEETIGTLEVRDTFKVPKVGLIAGCYVTSGRIRRGCQVHVVRDGIEVYTGKISSLKRFKDDVREVDNGYECGLGIENFNDLRVGDVIEAFDVKQIAKKLGDSISNG